MNSAVIKLDSTNTTIVKNPSQYNLKIILDLSDIYIPQSTLNNYRIFIETHITIPIYKNKSLKTVTLSLFNNYNTSKIINNSVTQYGYYEGVYDSCRKICAYSNIFIYKINTLTTRRIRRWI